MMDRLREGVNGIAIKIILGLIILSFVFAGVSSYLVGGGSSVAAKVGHTEIDRSSFEQAYQNQRNRMQSQGGDQFSAMMGDPQYVAAFRKNVLDQMINDELLQQYAESLNLRISDKQVRDLLLTMPEFQKDGKFSQDIYSATLRRAGFSADSFAEYLRKNLVRSQVANSIQASEFVLPTEVKMETQLLTQQRDIQSFTLNVADFAKQVKVTGDELQAYYKSHQEAYTRPEQAKVAYLELSAEQLKKSITITDADTQKYYQDHLDKYSSKGQRKVAHILIKGDEAKAKAILAQLKGGADFATLAQKDSADVGSAKSGGDLGWIEKGVMDPEFEKAAFSLKNKGEISDVVKSSFGYHIIMLEDEKPAQAKPYADVVASIKADLIDEKAVDKFYKLQTKLESVAFESPDSLEDSAKAVDGTIHKTDFISEANAPEILKSKDVLKALKSSDVKNEGLNSSVIEIAPEHVVVVRIEDKRSETVLPFEQVKPQLEQAVAASKGEQEALSTAQKMVKSLKAGDDSVLSAQNVSFGKSQTIDRRSPLAVNVYAMPHPAGDKPVYGQSRDQQGNIVVVKLNKVTTNDNAQFAQQISNQLLQMNNQQDLAAIIASLRETTSIEYHGLKEQ
ncbi:peptidylprolyl isomerase [Vibrio sp. S11_S32]|uniref:peptidylprolyl isomerase n=1 Tax=Vibrio sp. S11_S32 TaxID=2720225 RepID=UPI001681987A|nr:peptidylprolyl isomerase [Vibrio sp. S11_S32]MBD1575522.1 peptidylprolyl isomerase [Vibrio sp. S11_S32]